MVPFLGQDNCRPARHGGHRCEKKTRQLQHPKSSNQPFVSMSGRNIAHTNQPILRDSENRSSQKDLVGSWRGNDEMKYAGISGRSGPTCIGSPPQQPRSRKGFRVGCSPPCTPLFYSALHPHLPVLSTMQQSR